MFSHIYRPKANIDYVLSYIDLRLTLTMFSHILSIILGHKSHFIALLHSHHDFISTPTAVDILCFNFMIT